jgi:hypothetical protein
MKKTTILAMAIFALFAVQVQAATPVTLLWGTFIDMPDSVRATGYSLKFAETIDSLNNRWASCRSVSGMPTPGALYTTDSVKTTVLSGDTLYFAIKAVDKENNWSLISNIVPVYIPDNQPPAACSNLRVFIR